MARRAGVREDVVGAHLARVRAQRAGVEAALDRLPSADERDRLLRRDEHLAAIERALAVLLPEAWSLEQRPLRPPRRDEDTAVLGEMRSTAAVLAMRLTERPGRLTPTEEQDLAAAVALYRYAHSALDDGFGGLGAFPA